MSNSPPCAQAELLPVTTVRATHSQLARRLGLARRISSDSGSALRSMQGLSYARTRARRAVQEENIKSSTTSAALAAGKSASTALPHPAAVAAMQADPTRLAEILSRIDDGIAASERATPGSPGLQAATAIANGGRDTDAEINQF